MTIELAAPDRYLVAFDTRDLPRFSTDVLVLGAGVAGLTAALTAAASARVLALLKDTPAASNTWWAQGGVAAAVGQDDTPEAHASDTLAAGGGLCDRAVVEEVVRAAPEAIERLVALGTRFDRDGGRLALGREAGHRVRRVLHAQGDATGAELVRSLEGAARGQAALQLRPRMFAVDLLTVEGRCVGVLARLHKDGLAAIFARSVVLASGGAGRLFRETSNPRGATGDGIAAAYRAGAALRDLEFVQFHPTTLYLAGSERVLVTEAVRGEGARLVDDAGRRFLGDVHPDAELAPRDVVSRAIIEHLARPGVHGVYLDLRHLPAGLTSSRFPGLAAACAAYGLDPERDLVPVRPAAHYLVGGVACDIDGRTGLPGLYACGEAACCGLHGANRLASNSLLEGLVLGARAGRAAARERGPRFEGEIAHPAARRRRREPREDPQDLLQSLRSQMWRNVGIVRDRAGLEEAAEGIRQWRRFSATLSLRARRDWELENLLLLGELTAAAALVREESRGTHARRDFSKRDDRRFLGSFLWRAGAAPAFAPLESPRHG
ncbi:MAG: L-aspartate oxidase [Planctomycetota bacterium]